MTLQLQLFTNGIWTLLGTHVTSQTLGVRLNTATCVSFFHLIFVCCLIFAIVISEKSSFQRFGSVIVESSVVESNGEIVSFLHLVG